MSNISSNNSSDSNSSSNDKKIGFLSIFTGCMFSGKTTALINEITQFVDLYETPPLLINNSIDIRDTENIFSSHSLKYKGLPKGVDVISASELKNINVNNYTLIGIDEAQFFGDLYETVLQWLKLGKHIYLAGLNSDFRMKPFGQVNKLIHLADKFIFLTATCYYCMKEFTDKGKVLTPESLKTMNASFTKKISGGSNLQIEVGTSDLYLPVCRKHFHL